jgi:hypothetical protein
MTMTTKLERVQRDAEIREKHAEGMRLSLIAKQYGLTPSRIEQIANGHKRATGTNKRNKNKPAATRLFVVRVKVPTHEIGAMLSDLSKRNYQFTVNA